MMFDCEGLDLGGVRISDRKVMQEDHAGQWGVLERTCRLAEGYAGQILASLLASQEHHVPESKHERSRRHASDSVAVMRAAELAWELATHMHGCCEHARRDLAEDQKADAQLQRQCEAQA